MRTEKSSRVTALYATLLKVVETQMQRLKSASRCTSTESRRSQKHRRRLSSQRQSPQVQLSERPLYGFDELFRRGVQDGEPFRKPVGVGVVIRVHQRLAVIELGGVGVPGDIVNFSEQEIRAGLVLRVAFVAYFLKNGDRFVKFSLELEQVGSLFDRYGHFRSLCGERRREQERNRMGECVCHRRACVPQIPGSNL